jgi:nitrate reductase NapE component
LASDLSLVGTSKRLKPERAAAVATYRVDGLEGRKMLITLMIVCAILASLAFGVLAAYGICLGFFRLMAGHAGAPAHASLEGTPVKAEL